MHVPRRESLAIMFSLACFAATPLLRAIMGKDIPAVDASPLFITGGVEKVRLMSESHGLINFEVSLTLRFVNRGSKPVLFYVADNWPWFGDVFLAASREDALQHSYVHSSSAWPASDEPAYEEIHRRLDQEAPPSQHVRVIDPGSSWDFKKTISLGIEKKGNFDKTSKPWETIRKIDPLWLQVRYLLWPTNLERDKANAKFGRQLQYRWKGKGQLIIENILSEPMAVSLANEGNEEGRRDVP